MVTTTSGGGIPPLECVPAATPHVRRYHDHELDFTSDNVYHGLAGTYYVRNCGLPAEVDLLPKPR